MLIWSGIGWLPVVVMLAIGLGITAAVGVEVLDDSYWPIAAAFLLTAPITFGLGWWMRRRASTVVDPQTGAARRLAHGHTLFFVPLEYASIGFVALGIMSFFMEPEANPQQPSPQHEATQQDAVDEVAKP